MKNYFPVLVLLFLVNTLFAQSKSIEETKALFWGADDPYAKITAIPEKWNKESAVIIYQEFNYEYEGTTRSVDYRESTRRRIKLLDKSAVDTYSEFSFAERFKVEKGFYGKGGRVIAGVKVIKSDGTEMEIDMEDAVEVKNDAQEILKKIAVPNLEVGDVIDYYYYIYEPFVAMGEYIFEPIISPLNGAYPIMKQKLEFVVGKDFFINFNSLNGAPDLQVEDDSNKKKVIYSLKDENREKVDDLRWYYPRRVEPIVKFQVVYARKAKLERSAEAFLGEKEEVKSKVSKKEVFHYFQERYSFTSDVKSLNKYLKEQEIRKPNVLDMVKEAYYFFRYDRLISKIEPIIFIQEGYISYLPMSYGRFLDDDGFINLFGSFLKSNKIGFDVIAAVPRTISNIESLLLRDEITSMIRVNLKEPIYISRFGLHTTFNHIPEELEGVDAYELRLDDKFRMVSIGDCQIPKSSHVDNQSETITKVSFSEEDINLLEIERHCSHSGHNRTRTQNDLVYLYDYLDEEYKHFDLKPYLERADIKKKAKEKVRDKIEAKRETQEEQQLEAFEANAKSDMDMPIKSYETFEVLSLGRMEEEELSFKESFKMEGLVKRAGKNYILEAGKLIGGQVALKEKEKEREADVYMPFSRSFINEIKIKLPNGYTVEGLEKLNKKVENATGGFVSDANIADGFLEIKTLKYYKNNFEKADNWPLLVEFLEASYKFTQEKVLLKKQ